MAAHSSSAITSTWFYKALNASVHRFSTIPNAMTSRGYDVMVLWFDGRLKRKTWPPDSKPVLTPHVLDGFPFLKCSLDCNKILVFGIFRMSFNGSSSSGKPSAPSGANRAFRKNFGQCVGELLIKNGNIGGAGHVFIITAFAATMYCRFRRRSHRPTPAAASSHSQCLPSKDFGFSAVRSISSMQRALTSILSGSERGT